MNFEQFILDEIQIERFQAKEVLRCLLHSIIFNRALGVVAPRETESELFDLTFMRCGDPSVDKNVEENIEMFCNALDATNQPTGQMVLSFYERREKKMLFGLSKQEEKVVWEQWVIPLRVSHPHSSSSTVSVSASASRNSLSYSPSTLSPSGAPFGFEPSERMRRQSEVENVLRECLFYIVRKVNEKKDHIPPVSDSSKIVTFPFEITVPAQNDSSWNWDMLRMLRPPILN
eukprot:GILI01002295.1.p1 GENE.GILI01002295.1~~GILI01002295.1.p1  ORF type:complete len:231 (-),score=37.09 GILI01002295.1:84-776(-)